MRSTLTSLGVLVLAPVLGALACSGTRLNDVGEVNNAGRGGTSSDSTSMGATASGTKTNQQELGGTTNEVFGGAGATASPPALGDAGLGGEGASPPTQLGCDTCTMLVVDDSREIDDVEVNDQQVFWIEHGSFDKF